MRRIVTAVVVTSCLALLGCKKTEEGESKRWQRQLQEVADLSATYPAFKGALSELESSAKKAMDTARDVSDKKQRIEAMSAATSILSAGFVRDLQKTDERTKALREELVKLTGMATTDAEKSMLAEAKRQAEKSLADVDSALRSGARTASAAKAVLAKATADLEFADKALGQVRKQIASRESAAKDADKAAADKAAADKAEVADWTCEYCDHKNPHDVDKCGNCGAARNKPTE